MTSRLSRLSPLQRYLAAVAFVALAAFARWLLTPWVGVRNPYLLQLIAALISARYFGFGPSLAALLFGTAPIYYYAAVQPVPAWDVARPRLWLTMAAYY